MQQPPRIRKTIRTIFAQLGTTACAAAASTPALVSSFSAELWVEADLGDTVALLALRELLVDTV